MLEWSPADIWSHFVFFLEPNCAISILCSSWQHVLALCTWSWNSSTHSTHLYSRPRYLWFQYWYCALWSRHTSDTWPGRVTETSRPSAAETHAASWCNPWHAWPARGGHGQHWSACRTTRSVWNSFRLCEDIKPCRRALRRTFASHAVPLQLRTSTIAAYFIAYTLQYMFQELVRCANCMCVIHATFSANDSEYPTFSKT